MAASRDFAPLLTLLVSCAPIVWAAEPEPKSITVADAWAHMARRDTASPVAISGVITFCDSRLGIAYLQDGSGGIAFDPRGDLPGVAVGDHVQVRGFLGRREGIAMIVRHRLEGGAPAVMRLTAAADAAIAALPFDLDHASQMRIDGLLARVSGVIRRIVRPHSGPLMVEISTPSGHAIARLPWDESSETIRRWVNVPVSMEAVLVCRALPPLLPEGADALLLVPSKNAWEVQQDGLREVFARPAITAATAIQTAPRSAARQRVHVAGTVTAAKPCEWLTLRTEDGSVEVTTRQTTNYEPGDMVAVACWPMHKNGRLLLQDGVCRSIGRGSLPKPVKLEQGFFNLTLQRELVEVVGTLRNHAYTGAPPRYTLSLPNGLHCQVLWSELLPREQLPELQEGAVVRLTGILRADHNGAPDVEGAGLAIVPRSAGDIVIVKGPSWWTRRRLEVALWSLLVVAGIALPGAAAFRWQIWRQARHIRRIEGRTAAHEERRRIAREFHDSLQQQLSAAALHLETVKGALDAAPEMLPRLIEDTTAMIRHCQTEAQHCIWDLRTESPAREDLTASLSAWLSSRAQSGPVTIEFISEGPLPVLGEGTPFQILRICQEAVNNALAHAGADHITVTLRGGKGGLSLTIADDGHGFDMRLLDSPKPGHFGLNSLRERAQNIGARLHIRSALLDGTTVTLELPSPNKFHETAC
jgi:signal transduction histidine kinase